MRPKRRLQWPHEAQPREVVEGFVPEHFFAALNRRQQLGSGLLAPALLQRGIALGTERFLVAFACLPVEQLEFLGQRGLDIASEVLRDLPLPPPQNRRAIFVQVPPAADVVPQRGDH